MGKPTNLLVSLSDILGVTKTFSQMFSKHGAALCHLTTMSFSFDVLCLLSQNSLRHILSSAIPARRWSTNEYIHILLPILSDIALNKAHLWKPRDSGSSHWSQHWQPPGRRGVCVGFCTAWKFASEQYFVRKTFVTPPILNQRENTTELWHNKVIVYTSIPHYSLRLNVFFLSLSTLLYFSLIKYPMIIWADTGHLVKFKLWNISASMEHLHLVWLVITENHY